MIDSKMLQAVPSCMAGGKTGGLRQRPRPALEDVQVPCNLPPTRYVPRFDHDDRSFCQISLSDRVGDDVWMIVGTWIGFVRPFVMHIDHLRVTSKFT